MWGSADTKKLNNILGINCNEAKLSGGNLQKEKLMKDSRMLTWNKKIP